MPLQRQMPIAHKQYQMVTEQQQQQKQHVENQQAEMKEQVWDKRRSSSLEIRWFDIQELLDSLLCL